jgi:hypothetical protein
VKRLRRHNESQIIKHLIWQRVFQSEKYQPQTQREWARELGVTQQYVSKIGRRWKEGMYCLVRQGTDATLDELRGARNARLSNADSWGSESAEGQELPKETGSNPPFETSPPPQTYIPAEMHTVAEWQEIEKYGRHEYRRRRQAICFRIPGLY